MRRDAERQGPTFRSMSSDFLTSKFRAAKTWEGEVRSGMSWPWGFSKMAQQVKVGHLPLLVPNPGQMANCGGLKENAPPPPKGVVLLGDVAMLE